MAETTDFDNPETTQQEKQDPGLQIPISARFDKHRSSYWAALLAVVGIRYAPRPFMRKIWEATEPVSHAAKHAYAGIAGVVMSGVAAFYAQRTWQDMKSVFAENLAWEFDKRPEDVTYSDFKNSKNTIVRQTMNNFTQNNTWRFGVNAAFFSPFILAPLFKKHNLHPESGVDFGMAANAAYLFNDVLHRQATPFEDLQLLIDTKINHSDRLGEKVTAGELLNVYERHAAKGAVESFLKQRGTAKWDRSMHMFERMADLINQTYKNVTPHETARFGFSRFVYLIGHGYVDPQHIDRTKLYVEVANQYDIHEVKKVAQALQEGAGLEALMKKYSIAPEEPTQPAENKNKTSVQQVLSEKAPATSITAREDSRRAQPTAEGLAV